MQFVASVVKRVMSGGNITSPQPISTGTVTTLPSPASTDTAAAYVRLHAMAIAFCLL